MTDLVGTSDSPVDRIVGSIGPRLRELRLQQSLSLQQLAERAGVSAAAIHKIERNGMVPTITTLLKLADAFDRPVGYFVDEDAEGAGPVAFTPAPERGAAYSPHAGVKAQAISGSYARFFLDGAVTTVEPGAGSGPAPEQHQGEELLFMLDGALAFQVDGIDYQLGPGDALHFRTDRPHRWENRGTAAARALWIRLRPL
ncbi:MAG TPA: XRE family transcriptional regulator [Acidimicrobiales bacterium]|nr:XRE family transcriptional regulator [Acidimicrobiales bacterium]HWI02813.1 XRE family transcriptional regulator [Acidimicrobiales bacterium]